MILPYGGSLIDLFVDAERAEELRAMSQSWPSWDLTPPQLCDLELLLTGGFSPLAGFMTRRDYESVCSSMRLADGTLWPIPITLDVPEAFARTVGPGCSIALRDLEGVMLAALHVEDKWMPDRAEEVRAVYGGGHRAHPGLAASLHEGASWSLGGKLTGLRVPLHYDFTWLRLTPAALRAEFRRLGWERVLAFQTGNPLHRADRELMLRSANVVDARLLIHAVVGTARPGDVDHYTRIRCHQRLLRTCPPTGAMLSLLPLVMRGAGPRHVVWRAIIARNHGCTDLIVGRDHDGRGEKVSARSSRDPYEAQDLLLFHQEELGVRMVPFQPMVYLADEDRYVPENEVLPGRTILELSGADLRRRLAEDRPIPEWFTLKEIADELRGAHPPRSRQGLTIFFTGLSGAGKSTIANVLLVKLLERGGRAVTLLDGDVVRKHLSSELGFSREHRDISIRRIGFVASEITKNGGIAICAPIAPYERVRTEVRGMIEPVGGFVLVYVATPLDVCEQRDRKGLYAKARTGIVQQFTGISDPYEVPRDADLVLDTTKLTPEEAANAILLYLATKGYVKLDDPLDDQDRDEAMMKAELAVRV